mgnify:CR=1 FL=1
MRRTPGRNHKTGQPRMNTNGLEGRISHPPPSRAYSQSTHPHAARRLCRKEGVVHLGDVALQQVRCGQRSVARRALKLLGQVLGQLLTTQGGLLGQLGRGVTGHCQRCL